MGYELYQPSQLSVNPRSPLSSSCIALKLLSPKSMGLKLVHKRGKRKDVRKKKKFRKGSIYCHPLICNHLCMLDEVG